MTNTAAASKLHPETSPASGRKPAWLLVGFTALLLLGFWSVFTQWYSVSQASSDSSHLVLMPLVAGYLLFQNRRHIFESVGRDQRFALLLAGAAVAAIAAGLLPLASWHPQDQSALRVALVVVTWIAAFGLLYGAQTVRRAMFPLGMLLLMIPIPTYILARVIYFLQWGSAEGTALAFTVGPLPYFREGFTFILPGAAIEVAKECSGIRSSMALLITGLLAAHLYLQTNVAKLLLVLTIVPLAIIKNCIRIVTLTYLSIYVDPSYLEGALHTRGGIVFFIITLVLFGLVLVALRWWERQRGRKEVARAAAAAG